MAPRDRPRPHGREVGVSPVIGMILILAISVLGIVAVTNWGLPAIEQMQTNVEQSNVLNQFRDLDATMEHLVSGSAGQTTFKWQPTIGIGAVDVDQGANRWLAAVDIPNTVNVTWSGVNDTNNAFTVRSNSTISSFTIKAWKWDSGVATELKLNTSTACSGAPASTMTGGTNYTFYLTMNQSSCGAVVNIDNAVMSFALYTGSTAVHRAFLVDVGHVHWSSVIGAGGPRHVYAVNGGLMSGPADGLTTESPFSIAPPRDFLNSTGTPSTSLFVRMVKFNGTASFSATKGGAEHFSLYLNLAGTYTMATADNVTQASVYVWGPLRDGTYGALASETAGYKFHPLTSPHGESYLLHREGSKPFKFSAVYSLIGVEG
jgi:hypothetical protein